MKTFSDVKKGDTVTWKAFQIDAPGGHAEYTGVAEEYFKGRDSKHSKGWLCRVKGYSVLIPMTESMCIMNGVKIKKRRRMPKRR